MSEQLYDIYFKGEALEGFQHKQVEDNVAQLFKASAEKVQHLFSGKVVALKKGLNKTTALKFQTALKNAGAKIYIKQAVNEPITANTVTHAPIKPATLTKPESPSPAIDSNTANNEQSISVLPVGSAVLTESERSHEIPEEIDTSSIHLASSFATYEETIITDVAPDVSHISTAEVGADMLEGVIHQAPPPAPDTSFIDLAELGADLLDEHASTPVADIDVSAIDLADVGADMDPTKKPSPPPAPDTSHIHIK